MVTETVATAAVQNSRKGAGALKSVHVRKRQITLAEVLKDTFHKLIQFI